MSRKCVGEETVGRKPWAQFTLVVLSFFFASRESFAAPIECFYQFLGFPAGIAYRKEGGVYLGIEERVEIKSPGGSFRWEHKRLHLLIEGTLFTNQLGGGFETVKIRVSQKGAPLFWSTLDVKAGAATELSGSSMAVFRLPESTIKGQLEVRNEGVEPIYTAAELMCRSIRK